MTTTDRLQAAKNFLAARSATAPLYGVVLGSGEFDEESQLFATSSGSTATVMWRGSEALAFALEPAYKAALTLTPLTEEHLYPFTWQNEAVGTAFSTAEAADEAESAVNRLIADVRLATTIPFRHRLAQRLINLAEAAREDEDESQLSPHSLRHFIKFLRSNPRLKYPDVALTPTGNILAQWKAGSNKLLGVQFLPSGEVRFVLFAPEKLNDNSIIRLSGVVRLEALLSTVEPHGAASWIIDNGPALTGR